MTILLNKYFNCLYFVYSQLSHFLEKNALRSLIKETGGHFEIKTKIILLIFKVIIPPIKINLVTQIFDTFSLPHTWYQFIFTKNWLSLLILPLWSQIFVRFALSHTFSEIVFWFDQNFSQFFQFVNFGFLNFQMGVGRMANPKSNLDRPLN